MASEGVANNRLTIGSRHSNVCTSDYVSISCDGFQIAMLNPFIGANDMLAWSRQHLEHLNSSVAIWSERTTKTPITDVNPQTGRHLHKLHLSEALPWYFPLMTFDIVNAQRACLDHLMYGSAVALGVIDPQNTKFPFGDTKEKAEADPRRKRSENDQAIIDLALTFKPYEAGDHTLWALNKIRNLKHHRFLVPTAVTAQSVSIKNTIAVCRGGETGFELISPSWDGTKNELTYMETAPTLGNDNPEISISVAFADGTHFERQLVSRVLHATGRKIQEICMAIEAETVRLAAERGIKIAT